jgi:hypothetical protein
MAHQDLRQVQSRQPCVLQVPHISTSRRRSALRARWRRTVAFVDAVPEEREETPVVLGQQSAGNIGRFGSHPGPACHNPTAASRLRVTTAFPDS